MRARSGALLIGLLLAAPAAGHARPYRAGPPVPYVFPVAGAFGYGEAGARFGAARGGRSHDGQDVFAPGGTLLRAVATGFVLETGAGGGRGNYLAIWDPVAGRTYVYLHLRDPARVRAGDVVDSGEHVGRVGCTGSCWGDHLHFEVRRGHGLAGPPIDPLPLLRRWRVS